MTHDGGEPLLLEAMEIGRAALAAGSPKTGVVTSLAISLNRLARAQRATGRAAQARASGDGCISILRQLSPQGAPMLARGRWFSGSARLEDKDPAAVLPELEESLKIAEKVLPADHPDLKDCREPLARCREALAM